MKTIDKIMSEIEALPGVPLPLAIRSAIEPHINRIEEQYIDLVGLKAEDESRISKLEAENAELKKNVDGTDVITCLKKDYANLYKEKSELEYCFAKSLAGVCWADCSAEHKDKCFIVECDKKRREGGSV